MKTLKFVIVCLQIIFIQSLFSQDTFIKTFGEGADVSSGRKIIKCSDGNYLVLGRIIPDINVREDYIYLSKFDMFGNQIWSKQFGDGIYHEMCSIVETFDYGYAFTGCRGFDDRPEELIIIKVDSSGNFLWEKLFTLNTGRSIIESSDSCLLITGTENPYGNDIQAYALKLNASGDSLWQKTYKIGDSTYGIDIASTNDSCFVLLGHNLHNDENNSVFIKINSEGNIIWSKEYNLNHEQSETVKNVVRTSDGGFFITGQILSSLAQPYNDINVIKTNNSGDITWTNIINLYNDNPYSGIQTINGEYVICGCYLNRDNEPPYGIILTKLDTSGKIKWIKEISQLNYDFYAWDIVENNDGGYMMTGYINYDPDTLTNSWIPQYLVLIKTDSSGNVESYTSIDNNPDSPLQFALSQNYPNPLNPTTTISYELHESQNITLQVFDISGRLIETLYNGYKDAGHWDVTWNAVDHSSGVYIYRLRYGNQYISRKMLLLK